MNVGLFFSIIYHAKYDPLIGKYFYNLSFRHRPDVNQPEDILSRDFETVLLCLSENESILDYFCSVDNATDDDGDKAHRKFKFCLRNYDTKNQVLIPLDNSNNLTDINLIYDNFKSDMKASTYSNNNYKSDAPFSSSSSSSKHVQAAQESFVTIEDCNMFHSLITTISSIIFHIKMHQTQDDPHLSYYHKNQLDQSVTLTSIVNSMDEFNRSGLECSRIRVNVNENQNINDNDDKEVGGLFDDNQFNTFITYVESRISNIQGTLTDLEEILGELSELSLEDEKEEDEGTDVILFANNIIHSKKQRSFDSLRACYLKSSLECYSQKFPNFSKDRLHEIHRISFKYYSNHALLGFFTHITKMLKSVLAAENTNTINLEEDAKRLRNEAQKIFSFNGRVRNPGILIFEYCSDQCRLRDDQVEDLNSLQQTLKFNLEVEADNQMKRMSNFASLVLQRTMASGKTHVLGTLATVLKALNSGILSILVPPSTLLQCNSTTMQYRTYKYFKSKGTVFNFERLQSRTESSIKKNIQFINWFEYVIEETMKSGNYLILSPTSIMSFLNSYIECIDNYRQSLLKPSTLTDNIYRDLLSKMARIYKIFSKQSSIILDEIDMTMDPKFELNFPTNEREKINLIAVGLTADLFEWTIFSDEIKGLGLNVLENNQSGLISEAYEKIKLIWYVYIERCLDDQNSLWYSKLIDKTQTGLNKENILMFLKTAEIEIFRDWVEALSNITELKCRLEALIIIKFQIDRFIEESFRGTVNEHYGPAGPTRTNIKFAVPYIAANTPSPSSLFADRWETLNKSLMMISVLNFNECDLRPFVTWIRDQINIETSFGGSRAVENTATWQNFTKMTSNSNSTSNIIDPLDAHIFDQITMKSIHQSLNLKSSASIRLIYSFFLNTVVSGLEFPVEQITSNSLNMASMFGSVQGYSGTIDNINILPAKLVPAAHIDHHSNEKYNGGIVHKLLSDNARSFIPVVRGLNARENDVSTRVNLLLGAVPEDVKDSLHAIIDAGALLKDHINSHIAEELLKMLSPRIKCVLYYEETSNMIHFATKTDNSSQSIYNHGILIHSDPDSITKYTGFQINERFMLFDQRHITGSDILLPAWAVGLLTLGPRNRLRDILQGTLRLRQFMTTQRVIFAINSEVLAHFQNSAAGEHITAADLIRLGCANEDLKQEQENISLAFDKIDSRLREQILASVTDDILLNNFDSIESMFQPARSLYIRTRYENPIAWIKAKEMLDSRDCIKEFVQMRQLIVTDKSFIDNLQPLISPCPPDKTEITESVLCFLPDKISAFNQDFSLGTEVQLEVDTLQIDELEIHNLNENSEFEDVPLAFRRFNLEDCKNSVDIGRIEGLKSIISVDEIVNEPNQSARVKDLMTSALFPVKFDIFIGRDLVNLVEFPLGFCPHAILSPYSREGSHIFVMKKSKPITSPDETNYKLILISSCSAHEIFESEAVIESDDFIWVLSDLTGIIVKSNITTHNKVNIFNLFPGIEKDFFNLVLFNGSLLQMTTIPELKTLFFNDWLLKKEVTKGLIFLVNRMKALQYKHKFIFDPNDTLFSTIVKVINRDHCALLRLIDQTYNQIQPANMCESSQDSSFNSNAKAYGIYDKPTVSILEASVDKLDKDISSSKHNSLQLGDENEHIDLKAVIETLSTDPGIKEFSRGKPFLKNIIGSFRKLF